LKSAIPGRTLNPSIRIASEHDQSVSGPMLKVTDAWERFSFSFEWKFQSAYRDCASVSVWLPTNKGADDLVLVDRIQVEEGDLTEFTAPPVQLGVETPPELANNLFDDDDREARMRVKAVCAPDVRGPLTLKVEIADAWGRVVLGKEFSCEAERQLVRDIKVNPKGLRGVFHARLRAFDAKGKLVGAGESRYAVLRNYQQHPAADSPLSWEMAVHLTSGPLADEILPVVKNYLPPSQWLRSQPVLHWSVSMLDNPRLLDAYRDLYKKWDFGPGVSHMLVPSYYPDKDGEWARELRETPNLSAKAKADFVEYTRRYAEAFKGIAGAWELFNEINLWRAKTGPFAGQATMSPEKAAEIHKAVYPVLKSVDKGITVIGPCLNGAESVVALSERFLKAGGGRFTDVFSFHGYTNDPDTADLYAQIMRVRALLKQHGLGHLPIWNTEQYFGSRQPAVLRQVSREAIRGYFRDAEADAAAAQVINLIHHAAAGAKLSSYDVTLAMMRGTNREFFLFDTFGALNAAIGQLDSSGMAERVNLGGALQCFLFPDAATGIFATLHSKEPSPNATLEIPAGVTVVDMMGNAVTGKDAALSKQPVYLRFAKGTTRDGALRILRGLTLNNFGGEFEITARMAGEKKIEVGVGNLLNRRRDAVLELTPAKGAKWDFAERKIFLKGIGGGETRRLVAE
jgi:hypothetical protein